MEENTKTYEEIFKKFKNKFAKADVSNVQEHLAYQFNIKGEGEGAFYAEVKDGKLDPVLAFTLGKLKVEGNIDKALKIKELIR